MEATEGMTTAYLVMPKSFFIMGQSVAPSIYLQHLLEAQLSKVSLIVSVGMVELLIVPFVVPVC
jgi:hypothetical protein